MLEGLAAWVLNTYLGQYLENLNTDQLSVGFLQGQVELENVPLRKDALSKLDLPVEVKAGFVGRIKLQIPVRRLRSEPWVISIEKLFLVAGPIRPTHFDEAHEEQLAQERKLAQLDAIEAKWRADHEAKQEVSYYASSYSSWLSYGTSLVANIIENLQVKIKDVHIRYEDDLTNASHPFAWGITVDSLSAQSANANWNPKFTSRDESQVTRKVIELQNLAFYWDTQTTLIGDLPLNELECYMDLPFHDSTSACSQRHHEYILEPVSASARLTQNCSPHPLRSKTIPRFVCDLQLDKIPIGLRQAQYRQCVQWIRELDRLDRSRKYQKWRPKISVCGHARLWWQYAIKCHLSTIHQRYAGRNWSAAHHRAKDIVTYVEVYIGHLLNPVTLSVQSKAHKDRIEQELTFDEVRILREIVLEKLHKEEEEKAKQQTKLKGNSGTGLLQRWFPLWGGWYSAKDQSQLAKDEENNTDSSELEEEILDVLKDTVENNTLLKRDVVFAQLNFHLKQGTFVLLSVKMEPPLVSIPSSTAAENVVTLFELEFADVQMRLESRPRSSSLLFSIKLGAMFLRDRVTPDSLFPMLVSPHSRVRADVSATMTGLANKPVDEALFQLHYERKPFNSTADLKLHVDSQSIDMVYNPSAIQCMSDFFTQPLPARQSELKLTAAAKFRYEELKRQTKLELRKNWDQIMEGDKSFSQKWDVHLNVSAPQIIVPENFTNINPTLVIFDFGRLQFSNVSSKVHKMPEQESADSEEEDFKTPCSSPPNEYSSSNSSQCFPHLENRDVSMRTSQDITEMLLHKRMYDRYNLELCNLQVLVAKMRENWRFAHLRGTSHMHVLDRFNITVQLERRTVYTSDPQWPSATVCGTLPKLVVHVNEQKVQALRNCIKNLGSFPLSSSSDGGSLSGVSSHSDTTVINNDRQKMLGSNELIMEDGLSGMGSKDSTEMTENSRLFLLQFTVDQMSLEVQSRGRSIAELQVTGVKVLFVMRPFDNSLALTIHGLLLVDAMQTFGSDYELLVASHKHVSMDSVSGSMRDSEPNSPTSPASPTNSRSTFTSPVALNTALTNLQNTHTSPLSQLRASPPLISASPNPSMFVSWPPSILDPQDSEALITVEVIFISPQFNSTDSGKESLRVATVQFNNLDIIANQETMIELVGFLKLILPVEEEEERNDGLSTSRSVSDEQPFLEMTTRVELNFDFHHLSILLIRVNNKEKNPSAKKVATATMSSARIWATLGSTIKIQGSLGGLQVLDLTPEGSVHQRVLSVGHDPIASRQVDLVSRLQADVYRSMNNTTDNCTASDPKAFSFTISQPEGGNRSHHNMDRKKRPAVLDVNLRMASVCYTHSSRFMNEFALCLTEFQIYMANLAMSIKTAAAEVAFEIVSRGTDVLTSSIYVGIHDFPLGSGRSTSKSYESIEVTIPASENDLLYVGDTQIKLDVLLETPVVVFPRAAKGSDVLVAHLGQISLHNAHHLDSASQSPTLGSIADLSSTILERITIEIRDMNLYSMGVSNSPQPNEPRMPRKQSFPASRIHSLYTYVTEAQPILHDTVIELVVDRLAWQMPAASTLQPTFFIGEEFAVDSKSSGAVQHALHVTGKIVTPLKLSLSRQQYEQVLQTLDNLTCVDDCTDDLDKKCAFELSTQKEEEEELTPTVSALKLDTDIRPRKESRTSSSELVHKTFVWLLGRFEVPVFSVELHADLGGGEQGLVNLSAQDFVINYRRDNPFVTNLQVSLQALVVEDLLQETNSKHRCLVMSIEPASGRCNSQSNFNKTRYLSTSCPNITDHEPVFLIHQSLPDKLQPENVFHSFNKTKERQMFGARSFYRQQTPVSNSDSYPCTPPPSPSADWVSTSCLPTDTLVHINIILVDRKSPEFLTKYNSVNCKIDIDFNCLQTVVNLQVWVMVLDFFNVGGAVASTNNRSVYNLSRQSSVTDIRKSLPDHSDRVNSEIELQVHSLILVLNKTEYELARTTVSNVSSRILMKDGDFYLNGKLGSISVQDLTPHGQLYPDRFTTCGDEMLDFQYFSYGDKDPNLHRNYDMRLKIQMSSVRYIHTHRFHTELMAFFQHFSQLQHLMNRFRAAASGAKLERAEHGSRILLDVHADTPVILIPQSSTSSRLLVVDLGKLTLVNTFKFSGSNVDAFGKSVIDVGKHPPQLQSLSCPSLERNIRSPEIDKRKPVVTHSTPRHQTVPTFSGETIELPCLLDVMRVNLVDMDLYSATRLERREARATRQSPDLEFTAFTVRILGDPLLKHKCKLQLQVERNLDSESSHSVPDFSVRGLLSTIHCSLDFTQYQLIRGLFDFNFGENLEDIQQFVSNYPLQTTSSQATNGGETWTCTSFNIDLDNVTLELLQARANLVVEKEISLTKIDFIKCRFIYEGFSDSFKDMDLVSQEIQISDTRFRDAPVNARPNVFTNILQPITPSSQKSLLQAEFHYRATRDFIRFTILLNSMRVMAIFDWWKTAYSFIMAQPDSSPNSSSTAKITKKRVISNQYLNPLTVSAGILTKRAPVLDKMEVPIELKINITDTEIVVVEDASHWDTNAVILKSTAVISYRPMMCEKPLSCSLQSLEVFSCILGMEDETALSIIDPITVNIDLNGKILPTSSGGLLDATTVDITHTLEISMHTLNVRLSYHDIQMFLQILDSIPRQTNASPTMKETRNKLWPANFPEANIAKLEDLGFRRSDCVGAYEACHGQLNDAALWLTLNAVPITNFKSKPPAVETEVEDSLNNVIHLGGIEIRIACVCFCLIDDCKDADVPLIELTLSALYMQQNLTFSYEALATFVLSSDYYNRNLSGWEPFLEPWRCQINWSLTLSASGKTPKLRLQIEAKDGLNINVTSALTELYKIVKTNWTEDYYKIRNKDRRRSPFVPFALKNETGCVLWFTTLTTTPNRLALMEVDSAVMKEEKVMWTEVQPGTVAPFTFEGRGKLRHRDTHELRIHQLLVRVEGWQPVTPVSVDRVGVFFRHAKPQVNRTASVFAEIPPARVVFAVSLEGSAQKLVTVRSALLLCNRLAETIEVKLEDSTTQLGGADESGIRYLFASPGQTIPIPLPFVFAQIWVRPVEFWSVGYCHPPLTWQSMAKFGNHVADDYICPAARSREFYNSYRFCVSVKRENFPPDQLTNFPYATRIRSTTSFTLPFVQPGHVITLLPPIILVNLLPYDLLYEISKFPVKGCISSGKDAALHMVDVSNTIELKLAFENFNECEPLVITPGSSNYVLYMHMYDSQKRLLLLRVKVLLRKGASLKLLISAPYWLVNKSGLPLIFRQDGTQTNAAGQFDEHEMARSVTPLLFSFVDRDAPPMCTMRIGTSVHLDGHSNLCHRFHLEKGVRVRRLRVSCCDTRPDRVYNIGIDVRLGLGRYRETHIVTLSPRYQLDNRTSYKLEFAQKYATIGENENRFHLSSTPNCTLPFHWPRLDLDQLLCVRRADLPNSHWSGGFAIEKIDSFHINMRDELGKSQFLRVDIALQSATYFIVFTNADKMPPPYRIDNLSEVPITYYQSSVPQERLRTVVRAHSNHPYAWDEPTLPQMITCCAPGGSSAVYNLNVLGDGKQLTYENFIYIAFTHTFRRDVGANLRSDVFDPSDDKIRDLVLDVPFGSRVILSPKESGKRSQLWRMTSTGMLQHEGSSPPRDPRKSSLASNSQILVLDVAGLLPRAQEFVPLMLRKVDVRRRATQTWRFTDEGCLCCDLSNMAVQVQKGELFTGKDVVLGPRRGISSASHPRIPVEQSISRHRLWPGSGMLSVKVLADGPTRVLQIMDIRHKGLVSVSSRHSDWVVVEESKTAASTKLRSEDDRNGVGIAFWDLHVGLVMKSGIGLSLVNNVPEELIYVTFTNIVVEYAKNSNGQTLDGSVENIKIDNQLLDAEIPVILFVTPSSKQDNQRHLPAIHFTAHWLPNQNLSAEIFKHLMITVKNLTVQVEEKLLWKLFQFAGYNQSDQELEKLEESDVETQKTVLAATLANAKRFYFGTLKLVLNQVRLSMHTTSRLTPELQAIKHKMGFAFIKFEDAPVELDPFLRVHPFESGQFLVDSILEHYKEELKGQAAKILGSVDFIGNPLGLVNDFSEGLSGFINDGNVGGLLKNVTHGLSNSAAKMAGSLSDGLGRVTLDDKHELVRKKIWQDHRGGSSDHLMAGLKGLGYGILGGMTSIVTQTYEGAASEGIPGFFSGLGKGLVGTVAKPAVGVLDFATGAASAVRDTSRNSAHNAPSPTRLPRLCVGPGELLPRYSLQHSHGQRNLYILNEKQYNELFIAYEQLLSVNEDLRVLISSQRVIFLKKDEPNTNNIVITIEHSDLCHCKPVPIYERGEFNFYLELTYKVRGRSGGSSPTEIVKSPKVRCESETIMQKVAQQINYAKSLYEERKQTLPLSDDSDLDD